VAEARGHHHIPRSREAQRNVAFYEGVMGLRLVQKTANGTVRQLPHLLLQTRRAIKAADLTFFESPARRRGTAGGGM